MEILVERIQCGLCNCYIVAQGDSAVLVDTAIPVYRRRILKRCRGRNIRLIVLTHGHCDHAQNAAWLAGKLGVPVAMHPADVPLLRDPMREPLRHTGFITAVMATVLRMTRVPVLRRLVSFVNIRPFEPEAILREGLSLEEYGVGARIVGLPGHTRGSIGVAADGCLITGDALTHLFRHPGTAVLYGDEGAMLESVKKVTALGDITLCFGHGAPAANRDW